MVSGLLVFRIHHQNSAFAQWWEYHLNGFLQLSKIEWSFLACSTIYSRIVGHGPKFIQKDEHDPKKNENELEKWIVGVVHELVHPDKMDKHGWYIK